MITSTKVFVPPAPGGYDGYLRLAAGIVNKAVDDYFSTRKTDVMLDCLYFLAGPDAKLYVASLGMDYHPMELVVISKEEYRQRKAPVQPPGCRRKQVT